MAIAEQERGSVKMIERLFGGKPPNEPEALIHALKLAPADVRVLRWWWKGQPAPDVIFGTVQVDLVKAGSLLSALLQHGLIVDSFPIGKPAVFDSALINFTNVPHEMRAG